jgi:hypothetical protein
MRVAQEEEPRAVTERLEQGGSRSETVWMAAALVECLTLSGGILWIFQGAGSPSLFIRVLIVAAAAVLGGCALVFLYVHSVQAKK